MNRKINVLIIEDSALMRRELRKIIDSEPDLRTAGVARDGIEGLEMARTLAPDVVTIDVNLPEMDGLSCLQRIMIEAPRPCLMVSAYTGKNSRETFEALELGAADFVEKPSGEISRDLHKKAREIVRKIRGVACSNVSSLTLRAPARPVEKNRARRVLGEKAPTMVVVIGVSTGGPRTLMEIIPALPPELGAPVIVAQHMPEHFTASFAERMNTHSAITVKEARRGETLRDDIVYVAPGGQHLLLARQEDVVSIVLTRPTEDDLIVPSVNKALNSAVDVFRDRAVGVILTGMGDDGADAMERLHALGGLTIAESAKTAVIFGMPKEVITRRAARITAPSYEIAAAIVQAVRDVQGL